MNGESKNTTLASELRTDPELIKAIAAIAGTTLRRQRGLGTIILVCMFASSVLFGLCVFAAYMERGGFDKAVSKLGGPHGVTTKQADGSSESAQLEQLRSPRDEEKAQEPVQLELGSGRKGNSLHVRKSNDSPTENYRTLAPEQMFEQASPAVVRIQVRNARAAVVGHGSGFFVGDGSTVVTNFHVIDGANSAEVVLQDGRTFSVLGTQGFDPVTDIAILKISREPEDRDFVLSLGPNELPAVGSTVCVIGAPLGLGISFTDGRVSRHDDQNGHQRFQLTAPISPGSSGSPVLNDEGLVIGIASSSYEGQGIQNLNFAAPTVAIKSVLASNQGFQDLSALVDAKKQVLNSVRETLKKSGGQSRNAAKKMLDALPKSFHQLADFWLLTGQIYFFTDPEAAIAAYHKALAIDDGDSRIWEQIGFSHQWMPQFHRFKNRSDQWKKEQFESAVAAYENGIKVNPTDDECLRGLGDSLKELKRLKEAEAALRRCLAINAKKASARKSLGEVLAELGDVELGIAEYRTAMITEAEEVGSSTHHVLLSATSNFRFGTFLKENRHYTEATEAFEKVLASAPADSELRKWSEEEIQECHRLMRAGGMPRTNDVFTKLQTAVMDARQLSGDARSRELKSVLQKLEALPESEKQKVAYWAVKSRIHSNQGLTQLAVDAAQKAVQLDGRDKLGWNALLGAYWKDGQPEDDPDINWNKVLEVQRRIIAIDPEMATSDEYVFLGITLQHVRRDDEAADAFEAALAIEPNKCIALEGLGQSRLHQKRYMSAIAAFQKLVEVARNDTESFGGYVGIGNCSIRINDVRAAIRAYEKCLEIDPERQNIRDSLVRLRKHRND